MSNNELRRLNERQNLEYQYKRQNSKLKKVTSAVLSSAAILGSINTIKKISPDLIKNGKDIVENLKYQTWLLTHINK